ncbi:MAG: IS630 family transposase [Terriglobia bacterium]
MFIQLTPKQQVELERLVRAGKTEVRRYRRAWMVLLAARGTSVKSIAQRLGTNRTLVKKWLGRFRNQGIDGLADLPRTGRPQRIGCLERTRVVAAACQGPEEYGLQRVLWSHGSLSQALVEAGLVRTVSAATVGRILQQAQIKPHRVKMWCHSRDPRFQEKLREIVGLYMDAPAGEPVLCVDEKSGIQALSRSRGLLRARKGGWSRLEYEYKRHGTRCLFACFNVRTGGVLGRCRRHRKRSDFLAFMDLVATRYRQRRVHVVLDNLNTHRDTSAGAFISEWNRKQGNRFVFHYTPTHGSWLNQIELWFSILSRRVLRYGSFATAEDLIQKVESFIEQWNEREAHPFRWTYKGLPLVA